MKNTLVTIFLTLFLTLTLYLPNTIAQDYTKWNLPEGANVRLGKGWINQIAYSPDGTHLAVASSIGIWMYNTNTLAEVSLFTGHTGYVNSVVFSPDGKKLVSGGVDTTVRIWDVRSGQLLQTLEEHTGIVLSVAFSPDGKVFASSDTNNTIRLWDTHTFQTLHTLSTREGYYYRNETGWVYSVAFSSDSKVIASGSRKNIIHTWDVSTGKLLYKFGQHDWGVKSIAFSSDGVTLASGDGDGYVRLWGARTGEHWQTLGRHRVGGTGVNSVIFSPDGKILASGGNNNKIGLWDAFTGELLHTLEGHTSKVLSLSFSPDGRTCASASWKEVRFWNTQTGKQLSIFDSHTRSINSVAISADGSTIASGHQDGTIQLSDGTTGQHKQTLTGHTNWVNSVAFSLNGRTLASGSQDETVRLWNVATGEHTQTLTEHKEPVQIVTFSSDGNILASGSLDNTIRLWDVAKGEYKQIIDAYAADWIYSVDFSPDGQMLVIASADNSRYSGNASGGTYLWHLRAERRLRTFVNRTDTFTAAFSPDGNIIAGDVNNEIWLWNTRSGELLQKLIGHRENVLTLSFSPDGSTLASGSADNTIRLWDVSTGEHKQSLTRHVGNVTSVSFSSDGSTLASGSLDGTVLLWDMTSSDTTNVTPNTSTSSKTTVTLSPATVTSPAFGEQITFLLKVTAGKNVAGYQATVTFDTTALRYVESDNSNYLPAEAFAIPTTVKGNTVTLAASSLAGQSNGDGTLAIITFEVVDAKASTLNLSNVLLTDSTGVSFAPQIVAAEITEPQQQPEDVDFEKVDVNDDGVVDIVDLTLVASNFGKQGENDADVNDDGVVNIVDLTLVAAAFGDFGLNFAPFALVLDSELATTRQQVQQWLSEARQLNLTDRAFQRGIAVLEQLLAAVTPKETLLLPNYPNPFNPETWIPYQLATPADVSISIYAADGKLVRRLELGHQPVGIYESRSRAAYWDGRNVLGEPVASGLYFYTLTADDFTATRKMLIRK